MSDEISPGGVVPARKPYQVFEYYPMWIFYVLGGTSVFWWVTSVFG